MKIHWPVLFAQTDHGRSERSVVVCYFVSARVDESGKDREHPPHAPIPLIRDGKVVYGNPELPRRGPRRGNGVPTAKVVPKVNRLRAAGMKVEEACSWVSGRMTTEEAVKIVTAARSDPRLIDDLLRDMSLVD